jgi:hypothetical protein
VKHLPLLPLAVIGVAGCSNAAGSAFDSTPPAYAARQRVVPDTRGTRAESRVWR